MKEYTDKLPLAATALCILAFFGTATQAARIDWGPATDTADKSQLIEGDIVMAVSGGDGATVANAGESGASTYAFEGLSYEDLNFLPAPGLGVYSGADKGASSTGDADFDKVMGSFTHAKNKVARGTQVLTDLVPGTPYTIQIFYNDQRNKNRSMEFGDGEDPANTVELNAGGEGWGQFAVGTFTADAATQQLTHAATGFDSVHCNAILLVTADPVATISAEQSTVSGPFPVRIEFSEDVLGLQESDFIVENGRIETSSLTGSGSDYNAVVEPAENGSVSVMLPANAVLDADSQSNGNSPSRPLVVTCILPGSDQPVAQLTTAVAAISTPQFTVDCQFSEPVEGLEADDFTVSNGQVASLEGSGADYSIVIALEEEGEVEVFLRSNSVLDMDGDGLGNPVSETLRVVYQIPDAPKASLYGKKSSQSSTFEIFLTFSEDVVGLEPDDFAVVNGAVIEVSGDGRYFDAIIQASASGVVAVTLPAGTVTDIDGDELPNLESDTIEIECSFVGEHWIVDDADAWTTATAGAANLDIAAGLATPTGDSAEFSSIVKSFPSKKKAMSITFRQSPVWDNWNEAGNIGPSGAGNAPVFVPVGDKDYYFLGQAGPAYHSWHSTNMVDWVHCGRITTPAHHWVTTCEYKDGVFYIYYDFPNDHTPHVYMDRDLSDDELGENMGMAFKDPTHGSDCSVIRCDEDGLFHLIYEDWSPIDASSRHWDSPLAGHSSSADGISIDDFIPHEHRPPVDHRTNPTGEYATYNHPNVPNCVYEIHEPEQPAYGDWTSIKIGSQFYLFGDYDLPGGGMKVARFTSDSIYKEFELVGSLGSGHPDPTVGFAEGRFYLITQRSPDYTSPGPWVDGVEARAGVDIDGDGAIDEWTSWQTVREEYDHKPGYLRVVEVAPARIDMSELPAGYGFKFEFRIDDTVVTNCSPIIDSVDLHYLDTHKLRVDVNNPDWGSVAPLGGQYSKGEQVELIAMPKNEFFSIKEWQGVQAHSDNHAVVVMDADRDVTAHFEAVLTARHAVPHWWLAEHGCKRENFETWVDESGRNGMKVWESYVAGMDPGNSDERFLLNIKPVASNQDVFSISWPAFAGRKYTILRMDPSSRDFKPVAEAVNLSSSTGGYDIGQEGIYKVEIQLVN